MCYRRTFTILILIFLITSVAFSDDNDDSYWEYTVLEEDFAEEFPPSGWAIVRTNENRTWEQGSCEGWDKKCAIIKGDSSGPSDERLVTPKIECVSSKGFFFDINAYVDNERVWTLENPLSLEITYNYYGPVDTKWTTPNFSQSRYNLFFTDKDSFWLSFRYVGDQNSEQWDIDWFWLYVDGNCKPINPDDDDGGGGDNNDDDDSNTTDDDQDGSSANDDDWVNSTAKGDDDDKSSVCGCGISKNTSGMMMTFMMAVIGLCALILSTRKSGRAK